MKKYFVVSILLMLVLTAIPTIANPQEEPFVTDLIAGQNTVVGNIEVWDDGTTLHVTYMITEENWFITESHVHMGFLLSDFPLTKKGNPQVGLFDYQTIHNPAVTEYTYLIPYNGETKIAAHAQVCYIEEPDISLILPTTATLNAIHAWDLDPKYLYSYFVDTITNGEILNGIHDGWCVDRSINKPISQDCPVLIYSSLDENLPADAMLYPNNLPFVNYILNQDFVGRNSPGGYGVYTYGDVQMAIWDFIAYSSSPPTAIGPYSSERIYEIKQNAFTYGVNYIPGCGDVIGVILYAASGTQPRAQNSLITIPMPCPPEPICDTAWGNGVRFTKTSWAMYFIYNETPTNNKSFNPEIYLNEWIPLLYMKITRILKQLNII